MLIYIQFGLFKNENSIFPWWIFKNLTEEKIIKYTDSDVFDLSTSN